MKLKKSQWRLIIGLNAVLLVLVAAIAAECIWGKRSLVAPPADASTPVDKTEKPTERPAPEYSLQRKARLSLSGCLSVETNIGGSGDERTVDAYAANGILYIFGNTASDDFDMTGADGRAFMATLDRDLSTLSFVFLGSGEELKSAVPSQNGFLTAFESDGKIVLREYGADGLLIASAPADTATEAHFCALKLLNDGYALVSALPAAPLRKNKLLLQVFDFDLKLRYERMISSAYSLSYVDLYALGNELTLFFNATSDISKHAGAAVCSDKPEPQITYVDKNTEYTVYGAYPCQGGWALPVIYGNGDYGTMLIDGDFKKKSVIFSGLKSPTSAKMLFADGLFYSVAKSADGLCRVSAHDFSFTSSRSLPAFDGWTEFFGCTSGSGYALFIGSTGAALNVIGSSETCNVLFGSENEGNARVFVDGNDVFVIADSAAKGADVGGNFGGTDVWIARLDV